MVIYFSSVNRQHKSSWTIYSFIRSTFNFPRKNLFFCLFFLLFLQSSYAQSTAKALFIGNSYIGVNNLPAITEQIALSVGDTLIYDKHTPGGSRLLNHATNNTALNKIAAQNWDYVILQAQSQEPSWPISQVEEEVYPYAAILCDSIRSNYECSIPLFYMTWGRKNGDTFNCPNWPPVCTYEGMDSLLRSRYETMATTNTADLSPVGVLWRYIRNNHPEIELYSNDESHPSLAGSYAAACSFYTMIFKKNPALITDNHSLSPDIAQAIRLAAKTVVYDQMNLWQHTNNTPPTAAFEYAVIDTTIQFTNLSTNASSYYWDLGNGNTSTTTNPTGSYPEEDTYTVTLIASSCTGRDTLSIMIDNLNISSISSPVIHPINLYPNPTQDVLFLETNQSIQTIRIINSDGQLVYEKKHFDSTSINIADLPTGIYWLHAQLDGQKSSSIQRFVKE